MSWLPPDKLLNVQDVSRLLSEALMPSRIRSRSKARIRQCLWPEWGVLIGGSTGSALPAVRPPNCYITPDARCDLVHAAIAQVP